MVRFLEWFPGIISRQMNLLSAFLVLSRAPCLSKPAYFDKLQCAVLASRHDDFERGKHILHVNGLGATLVRLIGYLMLRSGEHNSGSAPLSACEVPWLSQHQGGAMSDQGLMQHNSKINGDCCACKFDTCF